MSDVFRGSCARAALILVLAGCSSPVEPDAGVDASLGADAGPPCDVLGALGPDRLIAPAAGSGDYRVPALQFVNALPSALFEGIYGYPSAGEAAHFATYVVCIGHGEEDGLLLFEPREREAGHARIVVRPDGAPLILEVPHPFYDTGTLEESIALFHELGARALIVSGTHRCASANPSGCDGTTSACGSSAPYVESDAAHAVDGFFHAAHVALARHFPDDVVVSVHGFADDGASVSDGTNDPVATDAPSARIARALSARFADVTSCNDGAGVPVADRLCGTTNVQGRALNGAADACIDAATIQSGRFVHLEQSRVIRDQPSAVVEAFREAFP